MDIASISATLASLKAAKNIGQAKPELKTASEVQQKVIELLGLILEAQSSALDAKAACLRLAEKNADLKKENRQLRDHIESGRRDGSKVAPNGVSPMGSPMRF